MPRRNDIETIMVTPDFRKTKGASRMIIRPEGYHSTTDAQFSIPFCIARYLTDPNPGAHWFSSDSLIEPQVLELAAKVEAEGEMTSPLGAFALFQSGDYVQASIEITLADGRTIKRETHYPKGHPRNRMSVDELSGIFRHAASNALSADSIEQTIDAVLNLDDAPDLERLATMLRPDH